MSNKKRIRFNSQLLERLAGKNAPDGAKTKVLLAMNADRRRRFALSGTIDQGEIRYKTLDRWIAGGERIPSFLDAIISYCNNNTDGITLGDFFVYDDGTPAQLAIGQSTADPLGKLTSKIELLLEQVQNQQQQIEKLQKKDLLK